MIAVRFHRHGGPEELKVESIDPPEPKKNEVLIKVNACALNHLDLWIRRGLPSLKINLPHILGSDISGTISEIGSEVQNFQKGDEVLVSPGVSCGHCHYCVNDMENLCRHYEIIGETLEGGYAEYIALPEKNILLKPKSLKLEEAAAIPLVFLTAWHMLVTQGQITPEKWVLIHAAGSGIGSAAIQIAKIFETKIIATASSKEKLEKAKEFGAKYLINYSREDFGKQVKEITQKKGVDIVFEHTGEKTFEKSYKSLCKGGRLVTCGATTGYNVSLDLRYLFSRQLKLIGSTMGTKSELKTILNHVDNGQLKPIVDRKFPLKEAANAHRYLEERKNFGKILLIP